MIDQPAFVFDMPLSGVSAETRSKVEAWGCKKFPRFCMCDKPEDDLIVAGGFFGKVPKSFKAFQRLVATNLKNWGADRGETWYERRWLRLVCPLSWRVATTTREERTKEVRTLLYSLVDDAVKESRKRADARDDRRRLGVQKLHQLVERRTKPAFEALAVHVRSKQKELAEARESKKRAFNSERFGLPEARVSYSPEELDECESWPDVKRRRRTHPQEAWKEREDAKLAQVDRERAESAKNRAMFGAK
jgi:hypothetical protein